MPPIPAPVGFLGPRQRKSSSRCWIPRWLLHLDSRTLWLESKEMGLFPQLDVRKNFPAVQTQKIWQWVMRRNEDALGLLVTVWWWWGVGCQEEGKRRWGRKPCSGKGGKGEKGRAAKPVFPLPFWGHFPAGQQGQLGVGVHMFHPFPKWLLHKVRLPCYPKDRNRSQVMASDPCPEPPGLF